MWILRFLNGPLAGQIVPLNKHSTLLGRAPNCDVKIPNSNVSKEHTRIEVFDDKLIITDVGSRNGTFLNGVQIRSSKAKSGDKIAIHDVFFEVQKVTDQWVNQYRMGYRQQAPPPASYGNAAYQMHAPPPLQGANEEMMAAVPQNASLAHLLQDRVPQLAEMAQAYMERVVLPGFFRLPEIIEFKWVLAGLMSVFILLVTALSTLPLVRILRTSIEKESQQHALTIATTLARVNIPALQQGMDTGVSVDIAKRPGVSAAYVISNVDGNIIAPASQAGSFVKMPYVNEGRKSDSQSVFQVDDNTVMAMVPVRFFNAETGSQAITAWAVVYYDMTSLAVDNGQVLSLFITTLFIALMIGFALFYILFKLIEHPIKSMNSQLDVALKEGHETVAISYLFPAMQLLASNVSSALSRAVNGAEANQNASRALEHDRNREVENLVQLIGFAAIGIRAEDLTIAAVNQAFEARIGSSASQLTTMSVNEISDQALKLSVKDLIERIDKSPDDLATNDLEFSGLEFQVVAQAVFGSSKIAYYLIVLLPSSEGEG